MKAGKMKGTAKIGIFSSSSPVSAAVPIRYERGVNYLKSKGFEVVHGQLYKKKDYYRSGTIKERAEEFNSLLYDEDIPIQRSFCLPFMQKRVLSLFMVRWRLLHLESFLLLWTGLSTAFIQW